MVHRVRALLPVLLMLCVPLVLGGWTLVAVGTQTQSASAAAKLPGDPTKGQQLFGQTCATCHGANLEGGIGPALNPIEHLGNTKNPLDPTYLTDTITNGLSGVGGFSAQMPAKGGNDSLTSQDIDDLAAFIIQQNSSKGPVTLDPVTLARSDVFWVTITLFALVLVTYLLSKYNMRWIARRAEVRRQQNRRHQP
ncbi:MAG: c-type cytochrome [Candidatus Dormibacteraceae bacterium]